MRVKEKMSTRQAKSIANIRAERRAKKLCCECGEPAVVKMIASTGKKKVLARCETHLKLAAARRPKYFPK